MADIVITVADDQYDAILNSFCESHSYGKGLAGRFGNFEVVATKETKADFTKRKLMEELTRGYKEDIKKEEHQNVQKNIDDRVGAIVVDVIVPEIKEVPLEEKPLEEVPVEEVKI